MIERTQSPMIQQVDHIGIAVADLDSALTFYTDVLGLRVVHRENNLEQGVREVMLSAARPLDRASQVGWPNDTPTEDSAQSGALIQLLSPLDSMDSESPIARFVRKHGPGLQQLAFTVNDVRIAARRFGERGIRVLYDEPHAGTAGSLINFLHPSDTGGVLVELVQPPSE